MPKPAEPIAGGVPNPGFAPKRLADLPVIDIERLLRAPGPAQHPEIVDPIGQACAEWGAFQLVGHGISEELMQRFVAEMRRFFALPAASKEAVRRGPDTTRGYNDSELTKNVRDWKEVFDFGFVPHPELPDDHPDNRCQDGLNLWPDSLPGFEQTMKEYFERCAALSLRLLEVLCQGLGLPPRRLHPHFDGVHTSFLRLNHYAPCPEAAPPDSPTRPDVGRLGVGHHTDAGAFTILCQDGADGLQVERDGHWFLIEAAPGALVVNLADMLQVWSNDRLRSPLHRVVADPARERFSAPFFYNPAFDTICAPIESLVDEAHRAAYRPVRWEEFRRRRAAGDYRDLGQEVQLDSYRL